MDDEIFVEKFILTKFDDDNLFLIFNNNILLYNFKNKKLEKEFRDIEEFQIAFGAKFNNGILRIYCGHLEENKIFLCDYNATKDSIEFYSKSENIFDDLLLDEIEGQELGNIACNYFCDDLFSKNILLFDLENLYVLSDKEIPKIKKPGIKKKGNSKSKRK